MINISQEDIMRNWNTNNSDLPLVSVRCITYNHEHYIAQALEGFLMQKTTFPFEIVVHDDASTDNTANIIREYEAKFPNIIKPIYETENQYSKKDGSLSRILNNACKGKYIALCEGDDYWIDENKLQIQIDFLEKRSEYVMCFHNVIEHYEDYNIPDHLFSKIRNKDYTSKEILQRWIIPTGAVVLRKKILETDLYKNMLVDKRKIFGDTPLFVACSELGKIKGFDNIMGVYRRHEGGEVYGFSFDRQYKNYFHNLIFSDNIPRLKRLISMMNRKLCAYSFMVAIRKKDMFNAKRFYNLEKIYVILLFPLYFLKHLFQKFN